MRIGQVAEETFYDFISMDAHTTHPYVRNNRQLRERYEKIHDPVRKKYYYYDKIDNIATWHKPRSFQRYSLPLVP